MSELLNILTRIQTAHHQYQWADEYQPHQEEREEAQSALLDFLCPEGNLIDLAAALAPAPASSSGAEAGVWVIIIEPNDTYEHSTLLDGAWRTEIEAKQEAARLQADEDAKWANWGMPASVQFAATFQPFLSLAPASAGAE